MDREQTAGADTGQDQSAVGPAPEPGLRARIARTAFSRAVGMVGVRAELPGGRMIGSRDPTAPVMRLVHPSEFFTRLGADGKIGFGEAYMTGAWTATDLVGVLTAFATKLTTLIPPKLQVLRRFYDPKQPAGEENTLSGARRNIHRHYDLSNDLFGLFLDPSMTYSCGWFAPGDTLEDAQLRKVDGILDIARVGDGARLLEIGTGWGTLAIRAAQRGARVTSLTISAEQKELADRRIAQAGVADRVQVQLRDYREVRGRYDAIASVEMIEAVGESYLPAYFATIDRLLEPDGWAAVQVITMPHDRMIASRHSYSWVHKYIFPGGFLPSVQLIDSTLDRYTSLRAAERRAMGMDYARTLHHWRDRFLSHTPDVRRLGFSDTFIRMWEFYLAYCEAGFASRYISVHQLGLSRAH